MTGGGGGGGAPPRFHRRRPLYSAAVGGLINDLISK